MFLSECCEIPSAPCLAGKKKLDKSSRLDVVEIVSVSDMLPRLFPSWSGSGLESTPVSLFSNIQFNLFLAQERSSGLSL